MRVEYRRASASATSQHTLTVGVIYAFTARVRRCAIVNRPPGGQSSTM
jgi:hypothetical protein